MTRLLSPQKYACCYKTFVATKLCCDKHNFVATKHVFCHVKSFVMTKTILVATSASNIWEGAVPGWLVLVSGQCVCVFVTEVIVDRWVICVCVWDMSSNCECWYC